MTQPIQPFTISAPGFYGLNQQDSPVDLNPGFALRAKNCVIDKSGRIASRSGWLPAHTTNTDLATSNITCIGELIQNDGTTTILAAGGAFLFKMVGSTLTTLTYGGGGSAPTISANNWTFCQLNGIGIFWQRGYDPLIYDPAVSTTTFRRLSEHATYSGSVPTANAAISAYGRIWCADTATNKNTVTWSDIITPQVWTGGTSGSLNLLGVWPKGGDEIVALAAHNNFLVIFGKNQTLIYSGADAPSTMKLADSIPGVGCIARDSVQGTGDDVIFLSNAGVMSLMRTIQEKSAPLRELSKNVRDELQAHINFETVANIKSAYSPVHAFYLLVLPAFNETYCFDMRRPLEDGASRVTNWYDITPKAFCSSKSRKLYIGKAGYVGEYTGSLDNTSEYRMEYYTTWVDFGNPIQTSILKKINLTCIGALNQTVIFKWGYNFVGEYQSQSTTVTSTAQEAEWGLFEWGLFEWGGIFDISAIAVNASGSGTVLQFGFEIQINGKAISVQKIDIYTKNGRLQ